MTVYTVILMTLLGDLLFHISQSQSQPYYDRIGTVLVFFHSIALVGLLAMLWHRRDRTIAMQLAPPARDIVAAEARLRQIQRLAQVGDWRLEVATGLIHWSEELFHIFGLKVTAATPTFEEFFRLIPLSERDYVRQTVEQSLQRGTPFKLDHGVCRPDGSRRYVTCQGEAIVDDAGAVIYLVGTVRDITDYKRLELDLQTSEAQLNDVLNTAIAAIFSFRLYRDRTWDYVYVSAGVETIYGYAPAEFLATPELWLTRVHPDDQVSVIPGLIDQYFQEQRVQAEFRILNRQGDVRWLASSTVSHYSVDQDCWLVTAVDMDISDRKHAEIAARQQSALLRQVIDSIPHHIFAKDETGQFFLANQAAAAVHGVTPEELVGHREIDFNPHLDHAWLTQVIAVNQAVMDSQRSHTLPDSQLPHHTGEQRWYQVHLTPYVDLAGQVRGIIGNALDLNGRKRLELALQASEAQLTMTLNAAQASIISYRLQRDGQFEYLYISPGCETLLGYTAAEMMADRSLWQSRVVEEDWQTVFLPRLEDIFYERPLSLEYRFHHRDGLIRWIGTELTSTYEPDTDTWLVTLVDIDISDRKQAELAYQQGEARLRSILNSSPYSIFLKDRQGRYTYVNPAYEQMSQLPAAELLGKSDYDILPREFAVTCEASDNTAMAADQPVIFEEDVPWENGTQTLLITKFALCHPDASEPYGVCGMVLNITERKTMEIALRDSQRQYQTLVDSVDSIVWEADPATLQFTFVSPQAERILGYPTAAWLEPGFWLDHVVPEDVDAACTYCAACIEQGQDHQIEYRMVAADGRIVWIQDLVKLVYNGPHLVKLVGLLLDISDRKQAEADLWESQQLLKRILDSVPQSIFWKDRQSVFLGCNQKMADDAGLASPEEIVGKTDHDLPWLPEETAYYQQIDREVMTTGEPQLRIIEAQHNADGQAIWLETNKVPLENVAGEVVGILGTYEDITDRKATEEALYYSEAKFRAVFEQSTVGIAMIDESGRFLMVNDAYAAITGYSPTELLSMYGRDVIHPDEISACEQYLQAMQKGEQSSLSLEKRYVCKDGQLKWVHVHLSAVMVRNGQVLNFITGIVVDITARKATEAALRQQTAQERMFSRVVQAIRSSLDLATIFAGAGQEANELLGISRVAIVQYLPEQACWRHVMEYRSRPETPDTTGLEVADADNPFAARLKQREVVLIESTATVDDLANRAHAEQFPGSWLLVPIIVNDEIWGSFSLLKDEQESPEATFSASQVELAQRLADQLAIAIQQSTLYGQLQAANEQLQYLATHDELTQLANRRYFDEELAREWYRWARSPDDTWLSLVLCDIDCFKQYNDHYGHLQGDDCLTQVAQALQRGGQRPADLIARYGGEEFAIILPETNDVGALHVVQQMQAAIAALNLPHAASTVASQVTLSFGIACLQHAGTTPDATAIAPTPEALVDQADQALYKAKSQGRNRYHLSYLTA
ncbi:sensor domain-containing diguanylate cyclase [Leptolyngbya iicbica]|uniref:PAS domain S-box protein n=1 Tax=Lyngbya confervoides BDU141951 TaxID=1574623 RepID=A0A8T6QPN8_9CYAN|nr:PAS domain S-box protein [Leptolyngbya sp. LK]